MYVFTIEKENIATGELDTIQAYQDNNLDKLPEYLKKYKLQTKGKAEYIILTVEELEVITDDYDADCDETWGNPIVYRSYAIHNGRYYRNSL